MNFDKRSLLPAAVMLILAAAANSFQPTEVMAKSKPLHLEQVFPAAFGAWHLDTSLVPLEIDPELQAKLNRTYNETLSRTYIDGSGNRIMLSVAYGGDQSSDSTQVHRPEFCYAAQGFVLTAPRDTLYSFERRSLQLRELVAQQGRRNEPITYWVTIGNRSTVPGFGRKIAQIEYGLMGKVPDGMLVRVSSISDNNPAAFVLQRHFIQDLYRAVPDGYRDRVFGSNKKDNS
ncbi:exosortase-associated protein EpsI, B-type [Paludibacterium yongneupense]|uniref:exosortase-associated protein EpsI, B-type n=1 Tax=Paludibacterium yongneupense TaxID=400061 RepID=UPI000408BDAD|nr:exosortase-associated protein EpsI, B-type [Paludibacterium yongneupense]